MCMYKNHASCFFAMPFILFKTFSHICDLDFEKDHIHASTTLAKNL